MLEKHTLSKVQTVEHLTSIWAARYSLDTSVLELSTDSEMYDRLNATVSQQGRTNTARKLDKRLIENQCSLAAVRARELYSHYDASAFRETASFAKFISRIYLRLIEIYQAPSAVGNPLQGKPQSPLKHISLETWGIPKIEQIALELGPLLVELRENHQFSKSWQSVGFITTQIMLSNELILNQLTPTEQIFINCYFIFFEEHIALPWQRMCIAAANHDSLSRTLKIIEQILPMMTEISTTVCERWSNLFPTYGSRRGAINDPSIRHSIIRDFDMFQTYLWLCFLEENTAPIEQELLTICVIVFGALNIPWKMTVKGVSLLIDEIMHHLESYQIRLVEPYTNTMIKAFSR